jgi:MATE family multidrug resistance protein
MLILIASIPFMTLFYACKQYLDGIGKTSASMWVMLFANLLNIGLNWCLIFGNCGFKPMGLLGAGLSTLISRIIQLIIIAWVVYKTDVISNIKKDIKPTRNGVIEQLKLGLPISIQLGLEIATFNICGIFMGWLGALPLAAHQTMYTISTLCFQILYGIGAAGTILISQFFGVGAWENIRRTANAAFRVGLISVAILTTVIFLLFERLASFFTNDYEVIKLMWLILPSFVLYQLGDCMQIVYANALRGLEDTKPLALIAAISYIFICIPLCYIISFVLGKGIAGVWMGIPIGLTIAGILFAMRFKTKLKTLSLK